MKHICKDCQVKLQANYRYNPVSERVGCFICGLRAFAEFVVPSKLPAWIKANRG